MKSTTRLIVPDEMEIEITLRMTVREAREAAGAMDTGQYHYHKQALSDLLKASISSASQKINSEVKLEDGRLVKSTDMP